MIFVYFIQISLVTREFCLLNCNGYIYGIPSSKGGFSYEFILWEILIDYNMAADVVITLYLNAYSIKKTPFPNKTKKIL